MMQLPPQTLLLGAVGMMVWLVGGWLAGWLLVPWLPHGYIQIFRSYVFGPSRFWTMAPLRCAAKFDPFLSLECAPTPSTLAQSKERKGSNFAIWQPCLVLLPPLPQFTPERMVHASVLCKGARMSDLNGRASEPLHSPVS